MPTDCLVSDTNIWIDLHHGGLLRQIFDLPCAFATTDFAFEELREPAGADLCRWGLSVVGFPGEETPDIYRLRETLCNPSLADVSCFYLASQRGWTLLTGDKAVRRACQQQGVEVHGTLWLLDALYDHQLVTGAQLCRALNDMLTQGGRLPQKACSERLSRWRANRR
jgi:hypothetical protein